MKLSIVATLYQSASYIAEFHQRASAAAILYAGQDYEIILVNDGSPDNSLEISVELAEVDSHVVVVDLSRNFGHHKAMMTGLSYAKGKAVFLIDSDLEEEPEWLIGFSEQMVVEKCDVVFGVQERRKGGLIERWSGRWFYWLFKALTGLALPENIVTARIMSRRYVDALLRHEEREVFMAGLWFITGFIQRPQTIKKHGSIGSLSFSTQEIGSYTAVDVTSARIDRRRAVRRRRLAAPQRARLRAVHGARQGGALRAGGAGRTVVRAAPHSSASAD